MSGYNALEYIFVLYIYPFELFFFCLAPWRHYHLYFGLFTVLFWFCFCTPKGLIHEHGTGIRSLATGTGCLALHDLILFWKMIGSIISRSCFGKWQDCASMPALA